MEARHVSCDRFTGVSVITCNRCGKENQDHYKFCLGCGSELAKPVAAPAPPSNAPSHDPALDRTVLPPAPMGAAVAGELRTSSPAVPKARGGIPWGDSPKMPAPIPFHLPPNPLAGATPPPRVTSGANGGAVGIPAGATPAPMRVTGGPPPAAAAAAAGNEIPCPTCGKMVQVGFAFCGACGGRIGRQPSSVGAATGPRTMFMAGSTNAAAAPAPVPRGRLILIRPDGSEGGAHPLHEGENIIGRGQAPLFDADAYLSPRHAELSVGPEGVTIRDLQSLNGVFLKISGEEALESGDIFRIGQELLRFEVISPPQPLEDGTEIMGTPNPGFWGRLSVIVGVTRVLSYQSAAAVAAGLLEIVLAKHEPAALPVHLLHASRVHVPLKLRAFLDFATPRLRERLAAGIRPGRATRAKGVTPARI